MIKWMSSPFRRTQVTCERWKDDARILAPSWHIQTHIQGNDTQIRLLELITLQRNLSMVVCNVRTVRSLRSFTRQCRYTSFPSCVVTFAVMFVSSKNGYGSWVVLSSDSSSTSSSGRSVYGGEISCQKCRGIVLKVLSFSPILATGKRNGFGVEWSRKNKG